MVYFDEASTTFPILRFKIKGAVLTIDGSILGFELRDLCIANGSASINSIVRNQATLGLDCR